MTFVPTTLSLTGSSTTLTLHGTISNGIQQYAVTNSGTPDTAQIVSYSTTDKKWRDVTTYDHPGGIVVNTSSSAPSSGYASPSTTATETSNAEYIHFSTHNSTTNHMFTVQMAGWPTGPTVIPATYDVPNDTGGRSSLQNLFRIYNLNLIKFGHKGYRVSFQHEDAPSTFNVYVCYTNTNNDTVEDQYSVNITTTNSNKTVYLTRSLTYLPKAGTIDIKFQTQATLAGNPNQTFLANTTMKSFTYVPNDLTVTFSPNVGTPGTTVTLSITGSDNTYVSTQEAYFIPPNWFEANVGTTTITKNNLGQFDYTNTFNVIEGTYNVTHPQGAQYNIANATYDANYVAPSTTSNGGGKPDRYPLIMTNLFNRNRSIYSIGMTHKDTWDLFL